MSLEMKFSAHHYADSSPIYLHSHFSKSGFTMALMGGKASVPNEVNDRVAPQGTLGNKIYVRKNYR